MKIKKCFFGDAGRLAELNKQLIEDEKSDNHMDMEELKSRMETFLRTDYNAYFFLEENEVVGYCPVHHPAHPDHPSGHRSCRGFGERQ